MQVTKNKSVDRPELHYWWPQSLLSKIATWRKPRISSSWLWNKISHVDQRSKIRCSQYNQQESTELFAKYFLGSNFPWNSYLQHRGLVSKYIDLNPALLLGLFKHTFKLFGRPRFTWINTNYDLNTSSFCLETSLLASDQKPVHICPVHQPLT